MLWKRTVKIVIFLLIGVLLLSVVSTVMTNPAGDYRVYQYYGSFYAEKKGSLDAVYIGSSATYAFWLAPLAWERYGIAVHSFASASQPFEAAEYLIKEARKTQPDALYIVPVNRFNMLTEASMHYLSDCMPLSWNKVQMVRAIGGYMGLGWKEQVEYLFPLIRYHSRWDELEKRDFYNPLDGLKGASYYNSFLRTSTDISSLYQLSSQTKALAETTQEALDSLLAYCDAEQIKVLFVDIPNAEINRSRLYRINTIKEDLQKRGYPVLDMRSAAAEIGLDLTTDYYNDGHTNIHGAIKVTDYVSRYLVENYGFADKRGDPAYSSWNEAYAKYTSEYASVYTLKVEWEGESRDSTLAAPELSSVEVNGTTLTVTWSEVNGADGYRIYRKANTAKGWKEIGTVGAKTLHYADTQLQAGETYTYTVIAYREAEGMRAWGNYDFKGVRAKTLLDAA